jgi:uncharacterized membrane protein (Fun14 family)
MQRFGAIIGIVVGVALIVARKRFAHAAVGSQNAFWGFRFGEKERKISAFVALLIGVGFVVLGSLALLGLIRVRADEGPPCRGGRG